ncbi:MAG: hypothetical protein ACTSU5_06680 [Promethearchaeota archaeon]
MKEGLTIKKKKICCIPCLGCCCLIPMSLLAGFIADVPAAVTGGLITNLGDLLTALPGPLAAAGALASMMINFLLILLFPLDWVLLYRPGEVAFAFAVIMPWILMAVVTALLFAKHPKEGFIMPLMVGIYATIIVAGGLTVLFNALGGGVLGGMFDAVFEGLTDRTFALAVASACLEGGAIGGVFGALIGALRYDPDEYED